MAAHEDRYALVPQMRTYDHLPMVLSPYLTFTSRPKFRSAVVNTDSYGFRVSTGGNGAGDDLIDSASWWRRSRRALLIGGSFAFGVGASGDARTIASVLNRRMPYSFLNLGIRAANSTQELIASLPFLDSAELVIVCSGINNLVVGLGSSGQNELYGPLFSEDAIGTLAAHSVHELGALAQARLEGISVQSLLREIIRRLGKRLRRTEQRSSGAGGDPEGGYSLSGYVQEKLAGDALKRQKRDLGIMVRALSPGARLVFATQPFAEGCEKRLCPEEERLFRLTDEVQGRHWQILKTYLAQLWPSYVRELGNTCSKERILFLDLNEVPFAGWSFVDRVHMTDEGYLQVANRFVKEVA
jgi:hypothetical protein